MKRITQKSIEEIIESLQIMIGLKEAHIDNEESKDYPNEDRLEKLEIQLEALSGALESLEDYEF